MGTTESISISGLADKIIEMTGSTSDKKFISYEEAYGRPFDDMLVRKPDLSKINGLIGYAPSIGLEETLQQVIDFERTRM